MIGKLHESNRYINRKIGESAKITVRSPFCQLLVKYLKKKFFDNYMIIYQRIYWKIWTRAKLLIYIVSLDIRKAFDSIDHEILLLKMKNLFGIYDSEIDGLLPI